MNNLVYNLYHSAIHNVGPEEWRRKTDGKLQSRRKIQKPVVLCLEGGYAANGHTRDVSHNSLGIHSHTYMSPGDRVIIRLNEDNSTWSEAEVVHCTKAISGFIIGLKMRD